VAQYIEHTETPKECPRCRWGVFLWDEQCSFCGYVLPMEEREERLQPVWVCGLDLGQVSDFSALCVAERIMVEQDGRSVHHYAVRHLQRWISVAYTAIAEELRTILARLPSKPNLVVDATGVGRGVVDILDKANLPIRG
jgi:hypothetical protein